MLTALQLLHVWLHHATVLILDLSMAVNSFFRLFLRNPSLDVSVSDVKDDETQQVKDDSVTGKDNHIVSSVDVIDLVKDQNVVASCKGTISKLKTTELCHHEGPPGVGVKGYIVRPAKSIWKLGGNQHESLKEHEKSKQSSYHCHSDDKVGHHVRDQLRQRFGCSQGQEHVEKVPGRIGKFQHQKNDHRYQCGQHSGSWNRGQALGDLVRNRMVVCREQV